MAKPNEDETFSMKISDKPAPRDFDSYLPWACKELRFDVNIIIIRIQNQDKTNALKSVKSRIRGKKSMAYVTLSRPDTESDQGSFKNFGFKITENYPENTVVIHAVYDFMAHLVKIKFDRNKAIPRQVFKLIGLILHYHKYMTSVVINKGVKNECLHELYKLLAFTNITDVCLDSTALKGGNYDILLEKRSKLKNLSISRCSISDATVNKIATNLKHPKPASQTLLLLNLASNLITDVGAKHLANALRTNRQLVYLNLSDNRITDEGAREIFDVLTNFKVTHEEITSYRTRHVQYLMERKEMVAKIMNELKSVDGERGTRKRPTKQSNTMQNSKKGKDEKDVPKSGKEKSFMDFDAFWYEKASVIADDKLGEFIEPFSAEHVSAIEKDIYCLGNNRIAYINMSYNSVGYVTLKKILSVLLEQQRQDRRPKGLVNICLEGNFIPKRCRELDEINYILSLNFPVSKKSSQVKVKRL